MPRLEGACITREQFLLREMRIACQLREDGLDDALIVDKIAADNLIQYPTEHMVRNIASVCVKRMNAVGSPVIVHIIAAGQRDAAAQANLYAMMCTYPLVRDFMVREVGRRLTTFDYQLGPIEMGAYITHLQERYENIAALSESTVTKIKQVLRKCLVECGMLANARSQTLVPIMLDFGVEAAIDAKNDSEALAAFGQSGAM